MESSTEVVQTIYLNNTYYLSGGAKIMCTQLYSTFGRVPITIQMGQLRDAAPLFMRRHL